MPNANTPNVYQGGSGAANTVWSSLDNDTIRVDPEIEKKLRRIRPGKTPFMSLLENVNKTEGSSQFEFSWMEEWPIQMDCKVTEAVTTAAATTVNVDNAAYIKVRFLLYNPLTGERMRVTAVSTNELTVIRGYASSAAPITAGTTLIVLGQATEEGQDKGDMLMRGTDSGKLYLQEISHWVGITTWEIYTKKRGIDERTRIDQQAFETFRQWQEHVALFGAPGKHTATTTNLPTYTTAGLDWFCRQKNVFNANKALTYDTLDAACGRVWEYGDAGTRYGFGSLQALRKISQFPEVRQTIQRKEESKSVGFEIKEVYGTGGWTLRLVHLPALDRPGLTDRFYITAMGDLKKRTLNGHSGIYTDKDVQTPGSRRKEWGISTIFGLEHLNTMACGVLENI